MLITTLIRLTVTNPPKEAFATPTCKKNALSIQTLSREYTANTILLTACCPELPRPQ